MCRGELLKHAITLNIAQEKEETSTEACQIIWRNSTVYLQRKKVERRVLWVFCTLTVSVSLGLGG